MLEYAGCVSCLYNVWRNEKLYEAKPWTEQLGFSIVPFLYNFDKQFHTLCYYPALCKHGKRTEAFVEKEIGKQFDLKRTVSIWSSFRRWGRCRDANNVRSWLLSVGLRFSQNISSNGRKNYKVKDWRVWRGVVVMLNINS